MVSLRRRLLTGAYGIFAGVCGLAWMYKGVYHHLNKDKPDLGWYRVKDGLLVVMREEEI